MLWVAACWSQRREHEFAHRNIEIKASHARAPLVDEHSGLIGERYDRSTEEYNHPGRTNWGWAFCRL
jgi:hypothetical protein